MLAQLTPIATEIVVRTEPRTWPVLLEEREIIRSLIAKGILRVEGGDAANWLRSHTEIFPERIAVAQEVSVLRTFEESSFRTIINVARSATETSTAAQTRPIGTKYERPRVSDLTDKPLAPEQVAETLRQLEEAFQSDDSLKSLHPLMTLEAAREALTTFAEPLRQMIRRAGEVGMRQAYAEAIGITEKLPRDKRHLDVVSQEVVFSESVRRVALNSLEIADAAFIDHLVQSTTLRDCPGMWLARAVELRIRLAEPEPDVSNAYDLDHVSYFPYTDAFFTDKRIAHYINQVLHQGDLPPGLDPAKYPVAVADTIDAIEAALPT